MEPTSPAGSPGGAAPDPKGRSVALSAELKAEIGKLVARYPQRAAALLPVLHLVQDEYGRLSQELQVAIGQELGVPLTQVREVVTFYEMFHEQPEGQFHLEVCTNIACHLAGADCLVSHLKQKLGIEVGHHTEDGVFSLMEAECLASCGSAPMMRVGMDYYEYVNEAAADSLVDNFKKLAPSLEGKHYHGAEPEAHVGPVKGFEPPKPVVHGTPTGGEGKKSVPPPKKSVPPAPEAKKSVPPAEGKKSVPPQGPKSQPPAQGTGPQPGTQDAPKSQPPAQGTGAPAGEAPKDPPGTPNLPSFPTPTKS